MRLADENENSEFDSTNDKVLVEQGGQINKIDSNLVTNNRLVELTGVNPAWGSSEGNTAKITATGNVNLAFSPDSIPMHCLLFFYQDITGERTLHANGREVFVNPIGASCTLVGFSWDGVTLKALSDYDPSAIVPDDPGKIKPTPPSVTADDTLNRLTFSHDSYPNSEIVVSILGGADMAYTSVPGYDAGGNFIDMGNNARGSGYMKARIKAAADRNPSDYVSSPVFTTSNDGNDNTLTGQYITKVEGQGGSFTEPQKMALINFNNSLESIGITKFKQILFYAGGNANTALIDYMGFQDAVFVGNPTVSAAGVTLDGSTQYVHTGVTPSTALSSGWNIGMTRKLKDNYATNTAPDDRSGVFQSSTNAVLGIGFAVHISSGFDETFVYAGNLGSFPAYRLEDFTKIYTVSRIAANNLAFYGNGALESPIPMSGAQDPTTSVPDTLATDPVYDGTLNYDGSPFGYTANTLQFFSIHEGLTASEVATFHTAVTNVLTALGR